LVELFSATPTFADQVRGGVQRLAHLLDRAVVVDALFLQTVQRLLRERRKNLLDRGEAADEPAIPRERGELAWVRLGAGSTCARTRAIRIRISAYGRKYEVGGWTCNAWTFRGWTLT
jgi:hypothetical protein